MILNIIEVIIAALLIGAILIQSQGAGLGSSFGGGGEFYRSKRSVEKLLVYATIFLASVFAIFSILLLVTR
ncbi:MAG: preprotein translocase subunit SecG [Candidatus Levybacteria bacterium RBG_16_35_11]|nr:MAG: preprotein translocase subunit SecG [Candidatus Levybacteria bacterium RBG_16_35_11]